MTVTVTQDGNVSLVLAPEPSEVSLSVEATASVTLEFATGPTESGLSNTFEVFSRNLHSYPCAVTWQDDLPYVIVFDLGSGRSVSKTFDIDAPTGMIQSIELSGDLPTGMPTKKTYVYTGSLVSSISYS